MQSHALVHWMDTRFYPGQGRNWDDDLFRSEVLLRMRPTHHVLDVGAGSAVFEPMNFRGQVAKVAGFGPDERITEHPHLDETRIGTSEHIPYADESFDLAFADNVLEHLEGPEAVFSEVRRVLRPGGRFLVKTPNRRHYVAILARLTPHFLHRFVTYFPGRRGAGPFPKRYRANTEGSLKKIAMRTGFEMTSLKRIEGRPEYLRFNAAFYFAGWLYERLVNRFRSLAGFRVVLIADFRKVEC